VNPQPPTPVYPGNGGSPPPPTPVAGSNGGPPRQPPKAPPLSPSGAPPAPPAGSPQTAKVVPPLPKTGVPPKKEHRYVPDEVLFELRPGVSPQTADAVAKRERLQRLAAQNLELIGTTLYRYRIKDKRSVPAVVAALEADPSIAAIQPNYLYRLQQDAETNVFAREQYAVPKLHLTEAHQISSGQATRVAVIDSGVDKAHPEIANAIAESYDATDMGKANKPARIIDGYEFVHGTEVAGIIASNDKLTGVAPHAHILSVRAFGRTGRRAPTSGTTYDILDGIEWAVKNQARVVNMSFAGPADPDLQREVSAGANRRVVFIAAVGNEGQASEPLYPAAYADVIAVTATDQSDAIFRDASRCTTICVAAPGVDILSATPGDRYGTDSGTSMAAAHVSGVAALLLDANPALEPNSVRELLVKTARHLNRSAPGETSIAGIVDAYATLKAATGAPQTVENESPVIERRSVSRFDAAADSLGHDPEPVRSAPPIDANPTGPDAQLDSPSTRTATDADLAKKEDILWQLKKDGLISYDQFQRQLEDLDAARKEFVTKCPPAPHRPGVVKAEFKDNDRDRAVTAIGDYGLTAKFYDSLGLATITVPIGQEWFWVDVLRASGVFTRAERDDYYCAKSIDTQLPLGDEHPDVSLAAPTANVRPGADLQSVIDLLKKKYPQIQVFKPQYKNLAKIEIDGLRGDVLKGHNYWERLQIHLVLVKPGVAEAMVEGYYAPGVGRSPPATSAYESMEKDYSEDLSRFTKLTFANLQPL
jgi:subtilisin family serine protease